ncbi:MAG: MFS transporter [Alphaproteobacteria bacterium]|nr:MFS transporter [Alphaproteobacteria bacterium]
MTASASPAPSIWWVLAATTITQALASMTVLSPAAIAPALGTALDLPTSLIGYQVTVTYAGGITTSLLGGAMVRRLGACRTSQTGLALCALGALLIASGLMPLIIVGSYTMGLGYGCTNPAAAHLLSRFASGPRINLIFSIKQTGVPWGGMLAGLLVPSVTVAFGWQAGMLVVAALSLAMLAALQPSRPLWDDDRDRSVRLFQSPLAAIQLVWRNPTLRYLSMTAMTLSFSQLCVATFLVTMLVEEANFALIAAGLVLSVAQASSVVARLGWGWLADAIGSGVKVLKILIVLMIAGAGSIVFLDPSWPLWVFYALFILMGATAIGWNGVYMAAVARLAPAGQIGMATGGSLVMTFAGVLAGPALFSASTTLTGGYAPSFLIIVLAGLLGLLSLIMVVRSERPAAE